MACSVGGAYTTEELLGWFRGIIPNERQKKDVVGVDMPVLGKAKDELMRREYGIGIREDDQRSRREKECEDPSNYEPHYNLSQDDDSFQFDEDLDPGNPTNPRAKPGDHDYGVDKQSTAAYDNFSFEEDKNPHLPIHEHEREILTTIWNNKVTVIEGSTGSGKTTQVPQFLLKEYMTAHRHCNIICTQPRRIAAKSVAKFVAECHCWPLGSLVGYQIGMDKKVSESTRLTFVTTGILLEKLVNQRNMNEYTHIILDEVHERDKDTDFCLLIVRKLLRTNSPHVKVVLMSATFETSYFANYFSVRQGNALLIPPIIKVGESPHPVHLFCLDDIRRLGQKATELPPSSIGGRFPGLHPNPPVSNIRYEGGNSMCEPMNVDNPRINKSCMEMLGKLITEFDRIEESDPLYGKGDFIRGTVLVFLPGLPEILEVKDMLGNSHQPLTKLLLHSSISWEEQFAVFLPPKPGKRKVILATNIAESSITVPDIKYVVDFCLVKQLICDWTTKYCSLRTVWTSHASLIQRMGRAGRVSSGRCYRLITRDFFSRHIPEYSIPEMQRCPIESIVLKCKKLNMGDPRSTLRLALQPPRTSDIETAILTLKEVGALSILMNNVVNPFDGKLTFVGIILENLPIDVKLGKLLILGHAFGCLDSCLVVSAALSLKTFFLKPTMHMLEGFRAKKSWDEACNSDCLAILSAYQEWCRAKTKVGSVRVRQWEKAWSKRHNLNAAILNEVSDLVRELKKRLAMFNIEPTYNPQHRNIQDPSDILILKVVFCGAFYPNYFSMGELDEELCMKLMSGHDPSTTVVIHGLPDNPAQYAGQLCSIFNECGKGKKIHFEAHKAFIEFERPMASRSHPMTSSPIILDGVYLALYSRYNRRGLSLCLLRDTPYGGRSLPPSTNLEEAGAVPSRVSFIPSVKLPSSGICQVLVTSVIDAGHFWAQFSDRNTAGRLNELMCRIFDRPLSPLSMDPQKMTGVYCIARFSTDSIFYRAQIMNVDAKVCMAEVVYIDYGNSEWVSFDSLCSMTAADRQDPAQAIECFLAGVKPSLVHWSEKACILFASLISDKHLMANIYCEVEGVLRVELYDTNQEEDILINEVLVQKGHAVKCTEPYISRVRHAHALSIHSSEATSSTMLRSSRDLNLPVEHVREQMGRLGISSTAVSWIRNERSPRGYPNRSGVKLKGPSSSYETSFYSMMGSVHSARIQPDSVNCITINNEPQDKHLRLMVAAHVTLNPTGSTYIARDTTLLPPIPGLPHLMCLLFSPTVEMRCDELKRQYIGALCGLGFDPATLESLHPEHDIELTFDTFFTQDHLNQINRIRTAINLVMEADNLRAEWGEHAVKRIQKSIRDMVKDLILKPRVSIPMYYCGKKGWNQVHRDDIVCVEPKDEAKEDGTTEEQPPQMYSMHNGIIISGERIDLQRSTKVLLKRQAISKLKQDLTDGFLPPGPVECILCNNTCCSLRGLRQHLQSREHVEREKELFSEDLEKDNVTFFMREPRKI